MSDRAVIAITVSVIGVLVLCGFAMLFSGGGGSGDLPKKQQELLALVDTYSAKGGGGDNEVKVSRALEGRSQEMCDVLGSGGFEGWRGEVSSISSAGEKAGLMIDIGHNVEIGTWNNGFSDMSDETLISQDSPLYEVIAELEEGEEVSVSGSFVSGSDGCAQETSLTDSGSLSTPDFLVRFTEIEVTE